MMEGGKVMDKTLFKEYEEWCVKNNKDPLNEETIGEFKLYKIEEEAKKVANSKDEKKQELVNKQKEIFKAFCDYTGVKAKYDEDYMFEGLDSMIRAIIGASVLCEKKADCSKVLEKLLG